MPITRRRFLRYAVVSAGSASLVGPALAACRGPSRGAAAEPFFRTRGVVLTVADLEGSDWPRRAHRAGLTTIATHIRPGEVAAYLATKGGQEFLAACRELGLEVEHELHAMSELLPRSLFERDPGMFRMDETGRRTADVNCCVHSEAALEIICENAVASAAVLQPSTSRHFYWPDDGAPMCRCPRCRIYSDSDQALILEHRILQALRRHDARATLAHLAYATTYRPPTEIRPEPGIFLEFAPIHRSWADPIGRREVEGRQGWTHGELLDLLDANLEWFGRDDAQVLEYWLDASLHCGWRRPAQRVPWWPEVLRDDLRLYADRGIRHVTTFAAWIDADYLARFGEPPVADYGSALLAVRP